MAKNDVLIRRNIDVVSMLRLHFTFYAFLNKLSMTYKTHIMFVIQLSQIFSVVFDGNINKLALNDIQNPHNVCDTIITLVKTVFDD